MKRDFNTLLIPVESQVRELDGKLFLACIAAEQGFKVIIGSRAHIHFYASKVQNCIYIAKSMRRFSHRMFTILNDLGHRIVAWDEESLVRLPDEQYYLHRLCPKTFSHIDHLFAWGESDAQVFKHYSAYQEQPIHITGNPRVDIIRPELCDYFSPEKNKLLEKYGDYILINTNFGQVNHFIPDVGRNEANRDKNFSEQSRDSFISNRYSHKKKLFAYFKNILPELAKTFPNINFILRPHPSENSQYWHEHLKNYNNVFVCNQGNVIPWIMSAKALISNGCTTSIEATILNKPTLGYYPITNLEIDDALPKALCSVSNDDEQLLSNIENIISENNIELRNHQHTLSKHISNLTESFASDKIIEVIDKNYIKTNYNHNFTSRIKGKIHNNARTIIKNIN